MRWNFIFDMRCLPWLFYVECKNLIMFWSFFWSYILYGAIKWKKRLKKCKSSRNWAIKCKCMTFVSSQSNMHVPIEEMVMTFYFIHHIIGLHLCVIEMNMQVELWVILVWTGVHVEVLILWLYRSINVGDLFSLILVKKVHVRLKAWEVASNFDFFFFTQGLRIFLMYSEGSSLYLFKIILKTKKGTYEISSLLHPWEYIHTPIVEPRVLCKWEKERERESAEWHIQGR